MQPSNPFSKFMEHKEHRAYIKSLDYEITYRKLLQHEDDAFNIRLLANGEMNIEVGTEIKYEKVSMCMLDPIITVQQLKEMDADVGTVIIEILKVIEKSDMVDEDGTLRELSSSDKLLHRIAETLSMPVYAVRQTMTRDEIDGWLSYFVYKDPDAHEIQMAILIANVKNAMSSKSKSKVTDYLITKKPKKTITKSEGAEEMIQIGKYMPIRKADLHKYLK